MISAQENEILTRVGPETPMGRMMRRYWLPVCTSEQLPKPDCDPLRVRLLGERFIAFRDTSGRPGFLEEYCMHRRASLAMGRVWRATASAAFYRRWKFGVDGTIQENPNHFNDRPFATAFGRRHLQDARQKT